MRDNAVLPAIKAAESTASGPAIFLAISLHQICIVYGKQREPWCASKIWNKSAEEQGANPPFFTAMGALSRS